MVPELHKLLLAIKKNGVHHQVNNQIVGRQAATPPSQMEIFKKTKDFVDTIVSTYYMNMAFSRNRPMSSTLQH
jgi:hypothetical protein